MITYYLLAITIGLYLSSLLLYVFYYRDLVKYTSKKPIYMNVVKACPMNKDKCDKCIYTIYREYPNLKKRCEMEWSKYE